MPELAAVLIDCVDGGASISFMSGFSTEDGISFFECMFDDAARANRIIMAAFDESGSVTGTVQLIVNVPPNQPHRADVAKLLVKRSARGRGVAAKLMTELETVARSCGKWLLTLDTVTGGDAERLYARLGWSRTGVIPEYALMPDGALCSTTIFWKKLL